MRARVVAIVLVVGCGHPGLNDAGKQREVDPAAAAPKYHAVARSECATAPPNTDVCCEALAGEAESLIASGQRNAGLAAFDDALHTCPAHAGLRRRRHLARHATPVATGSVTTNVQVSYRVNLKDDLKLRMHAAFIDGQLLAKKEVSLTTGSHYLEVEAYVSAAAEREHGIMRVAAERPFVIPRELAREKLLDAYFTVTVSDAGAPAIPSERLRVDVDAGSVKPAEDLLKMVAESMRAGPRPPPPPPPARPPEQRTVQLLPPNVGKALLDPSSSIQLPEPDSQLKGWMLLKVCVTMEGAVNDVVLIHTTNPALTGPTFAMIRKWRYRPYLLGGLPYPFCHPMRFEQR
jgi:hypothetical protein